MVVKQELFRESIGKMKAKQRKSKAGRKMYDLVYMKGTYTATTV